MGATPSGAFDAFANGVFTSFLLKQCLPTLICNIKR